MIREISTVPIAQGGAGTTELVPALVGRRICVTSYVVVMSAAGTLKFTSGGSDKTGAMDLATNGGLVVCSDEETPVLVGAQGGALEIVTTVGAAKGHLTYWRG